MFEIKEGSSLFFNMQINIVKNYDIHESNYWLVLFLSPCIKTLHIFLWRLKIVENLSWDSFNKYSYGNWGIIRLPNWHIMEWYDD